MTNDFSNLKAGDRVWLGCRRDAGTTIKPVHHTTATQIVVDWNGNGEYLKRCYRHNGYEVGGGYLCHKIIRLATPEECAEWDAKQARKQQEKADREAAEQRAEEQRAELEGMFGSDVSVCNEQWGSDEARAGLWTVEFHRLTTAQVRELAELIRRNVAGGALTQASPRLPE